jgi:hypothetical protein
MKNFKIEFLLELLSIFVQPQHHALLVSQLKLMPTSVGILPTCVRLRRNAGSELMIPTKGEIIGSLMNLATRKVIAHVAVNNGSCKRGFIKNLVDMAAEVAPALKISRDDINNKVRRIQDPPKQQQQEVSPAIPYHAIVCPTLSTNSDLSISADLISERTSAENPLDILEDQAAVML